jgi:flagellar biosynthesis protein FlhF
MAQALKIIREDMGENAVIISTQEKPDGVYVTVAVDNSFSPEKKAQAPSQVPEPLFRRSLDLLNSVSRICDHHRVSFRLKDLWLETLPTYSRTSERPIEESLANIISFDEKWLETLSSAVPIVLVGPSGSGKTVTLAKLAAQLLLKSQPVSVITSDTIKAGAISQLSTYVEAMKLTPKIAQDVEEICDYVNSKADSEILLIDTPGLNPYDSEEMAAIRYLQTRLPLACFVLILPAGLDANEASEIATRFAYVNASKLIITRMDAARYYGAILNASYDGRLPLVGYGSSPEILSGIHPLNKKTLTDFLFQSTFTTAG